MCPPAPISPPAEMDEFWTDEGVFMSLLKFKSGCPLPLNVISDVNPYQFKPSDLPADLWYFCSGIKKDAECGFWLATGEACEIFSNSSIVGFRTTLQFYEGRAPHGCKTDWVMQEYRITEKCNNNLKDHRALCRVFSADENKLPSGHSIADIDVTNSNDLGPKTVLNVNSSGHISNSELLDQTMGNDTGPSLMAKSSPDPFLENSSERDYVSRGDYLELNDLVDPVSRWGDYLELNDLVDPVSRSSSSANSSCLTMTSEECFDSMALLRELEDEITDKEMKDSSVKFNLSASVKPKEVVIRPATSGSLRIGEEHKPSTQETSKVNHRKDNTSNGVNTAASSSSSEGSSRDGKKEGVGRTKKRKMMKYLCFMAF